MMTRSQSSPGEICVQMAMSDDPRVSSILGSEAGDLSCVAEGSFRFVELPAHLAGLGFQVVEFDQCQAQSGADLRFPALWTVHGGNPFSWSVAAGFLVHLTRTVL